MEDEILHEFYLPFTEEQVKEHFVKSNDSSQENNLNYYKNSIERYDSKYRGKDIAQIRQIEKDEKFWTLSTFLTLYYGDNFKENLQELLSEVYGENPPLGNFSKWDDCLNGKIRIFFEPNISGPEKYKKDLQENILKKQFIPYILDKAKEKDGNFRQNLEGATNVDALILNIDNGFNVIVEAKVLSDISYETTNDLIRNQIARNIDIMLEEPKNVAHEPLKKRIPDNSLFLLVTPKLFKKNPKSRLYGYKYNDYKENPKSINEDLPHLSCEWEKLSKRIGWTTWEDIKEINSSCCKWLDKK